MARVRFSDLSQTMTSLTLKYLSHSDIHVSLADSIFVAKVLRSALVNLTVRNRVSVAGIWSAANPAVLSSRPIISSLMFEPVNNFGKSEGWVSTGTENGFDVALRISAASLPASRKSWLKRRAANLRDASAS